MTSGSSSINGSFSSHIFLNESKVWDKMVSIITEINPEIESIYKKPEKLSKHQTL